MLALPLVSCTKTGTGAGTDTATETVGGTSMETELDAGDDTKAPDTEAADDGKIYTTIIQNIAEYVIVVPEDASEAISEVVEDLNKAIKKEVGAELTVVTSSTEEATYEILVGNISRKESENATSKLRTKDYVVKLDGNKLVMAGGNEEALIDAVNEFKNNFIVAGMVLAPTGRGLAYKYDYRFESVSINGKSITEYKIYSTNEECSERLAKNVFEKFSDETVEVATEMKAGEGQYIVLDPQSMNYTHYKAELRDGNLYVSGSYKSCYEFLDYFAKQGVKNVDITEGFEGDIDRPELYTKEELMYVLEKAYNTQDRLIIGQEIYVALKTPYKGSIDLFYEATGEYPGIVGTDLSWAGLRMYEPAYSYDLATDELKSQVFCEMVEYAEKGGIFTVGSHFANPNVEGTAHLDAKNECRGFLGKDDAFAAVITPGTALNNNFMAELELCIEYLQAMQEIGLTVIYRPFHEMNAPYFWWGLDQAWADGSKYRIQNESFINLWKYLHNVYDDAGLDNLIWQYCPDVSYIGNLEAYPGDDYCDIVGSDWYTTGGSGKIEVMENGTVRPLASLMKTGKVVGLAEVGNWTTEYYYGEKSEEEIARIKEAQLELFNGMDLTQNLRTILDNGYQLAYAMTWTQQHSFEYLGKGREAMKTGIYICRDELVDWFAEARATLRGNE